MPELSIADFARVQFLLLLFVSVRSHVNVNVDEFTAANGAQLFLVAMPQFHVFLQRFLVFVFHATNRALKRTRGIRIWLNSLGGGIAFFDFDLGIIMTIIVIPVVMMVTIVTATKVIDVIIYRFICV